MISRTVQDERTQPTAHVPWYRTAKRAYLLDFQMPDSSDQTVIGQPTTLRNLDVAAIVRQLHDAGVAALYVHAKDNQGNCYYDTALGHKHTGIGDRDLLAEFVRECRARAMHILFYVQLARERRSFLHEAHQARHADGTPVLMRESTPLLPSPEDRPVVCMNGPHREYILAIARELAANYNPDGLWFDAFSFWGRVEPCYCETCRAKYRADTGLELPPSPSAPTPVWRAYRQWRRRLNTLIWREIAGAVRAIKPHLTVTHNGALQGWADHEFFDYDDYATDEFHYSRGHGTLSLECRQRAALKPGVPFETEIWRFFNRMPDTPRGYQVRPLPMHLVEMATVVAHGGMVQYYDQINPDGTLDPRSIAVLGAAFAEIRRHEPWLEGGTPVAHCGVVWSKATEAYAPLPHAEMHRNALAGVHHALMEEHLPLMLLTDRQVARGAFGANRVVVLPSVTCLSDVEAGHLRAFVEAGGGLVATYRTGLCDAVGVPRQDFVLADLFGAEYLEPISYLHSFVRPDVAHPVTADLPLDWPLPLWKMPQLKVAPHSADVLGKVVYPMRGFPMGHPPQEVTDHPAILVRVFGKGRVVYLPAPIDAVYGEYGHPDYRRLLVNATRWAAGEPSPVEVHAPLTLEMVAWEQGNGARLVIHLLNRTASGGARTRPSVVQEVIPVHDVIVRVRDGGRWARATLQPCGDELPLSRGTDTPAVELTVPRVDIHAMLVFER